jgi:LacI family transcriptional regulator, galactose operon repressor
MALGYYDHQLHRGVVRYAREAGWSLDTSMAHYGVLPEHWQGDGVLTLLLPHREDVLQFTREQDVPVVGLSLDVEEIGVPRVCLDNEQIGQLAAEHLLERGFENLAFYKFSNICDVRGRETGFREAAEKAGARFLPLDWHAASHDHNQQGWFEWLKEQLRALPQPMGIMAQSDNRAAQLINACEGAGLTIPDEIAVVGVDNDEYACEFASVPISSVDSGRESLAYEGASLLGRLMQGEQPSDSTLAIEPRSVVVRKSSDILAVPHKAVARALSFIWEHFRDRIGVDDVVAQSYMSRCGLYRAFEKHVGRSIGEELARKRVEYAKTLLAESDEKLHRIARLSGFTGGEHFSRAFTRIVGSTPSEYRRKTQS